MKRVFLLKHQMYMQSVRIKIEDAQYQLFMQFLKTLDFVEITSPKSEKEVSPSIEKGSFKAGEKPSDLAGLWKGDKRNLKELRERAWRYRFCG
jgi:hypothetical protein